MNSPIDSAVISLYGEFGVPADQLLLRRDLAERFVDEVRRRVSEPLPDSSDVLGRVLTLRKCGRLPRLERAYRGRHLA